MGEMIAGAAIGALWASLLAMILVDAMREDLGPVRVHRVYVDPETMHEWTADRVWRATMHVMHNMEKFTRYRSWDASPSPEDAS